MLIHMCIVILFPMRKCKICFMFLCVYCIHSMQQSDTYSYKGVEWGYVVHILLPNKRHQCSAIYIRRVARVKIESWNFQHLFDLGFRETLQTFSSFIQTFRWLSSVGNKSCLNKLKFCEVSRNYKSKRYEKFQISILTNKKVLFLKIYCSLIGGLSKIGLIFSALVQWKTTTFNLEASILKIIIVSIELSQMCMLIR